MVVGYTTTGTGSTTNASPLLELAANYYTGSASAQDLWTLGSALSAGTNGVSIVKLAHTGSTGVSYLQLPGGAYNSGTNIQFNSQYASIDFNHNGGGLYFTQQNGAYAWGIIVGSYNGPFGMECAVEGVPVTLSSNFLGKTNASSIAIGNASPAFTAASGTVYGLRAGQDANLGYSFTPGATSTASLSA